jgi:hypothetical protein
MRQIRYKDGTPSREVDDGDNPDDWENTGQDEMNDLYDECTEKKSIVDIRDDLNNICDLIHVCAAALRSEDKGLKEYTATKVAHVLYFCVESKLVDIEEDLEKL